MTADTPEPQEPLRETYDGAGSTTGLVVEGEPPWRPDEAELLEIEVARLPGPLVVAVRSRDAMPEAIPRQRPNVGAKKTMSRY